jgi:O-antigen/teichoic acid export membrane protein
MIRKAFFWSFSAQLVSFVVMFIGSLIVARLLSPREMGVYAVSLATIGVLQIIAAFGVGNFVIRATELDARMLDTAFTVNAVLGVSLAVTIFALSYAGGAFLGEPAVAQVMRLLALSPLISIFDFRPSSMLQREMQFKRVSAVSTAQAVTSSGVTILAALQGASYFSPAIGGLAAALVAAIGYSILGRQHVAIRFCMVGWKPMAAFGFRMMSIGGISNVASRLSDIVLGHLLGLAALGLFGRASNLSNLIFQNIYGTATRVIFAKMSKDYRETGQLRDTYLKGIRYIAALMGPLLIGLAVLAKPAIQLMYGARWQGAAVPLSCLMVAQFITLRFAMNWELFVIKDELRVQTRIEITRSVFSLLSRTVGSLFSVAAAAGAAIVDALFSVALYGTQINRMIDVEERVLMRVSIEAVVLTAAAVAPAFALMVTFDWNEHTPLLLVFGSVGLGIALWLVTMTWQKHPLLEELRRGLVVSTQWLKTRGGGRSIEPADPSGKEAP